MMRSTGEWERACAESLTRSARRRAAERAAPLIPRDRRALAGVLIAAACIALVLAVLAAAMPA